MLYNITKREKLLIVLSGIFITNAILGELIGGKLIQIGPFTMSIGVIPWPIVFLTTDLINEYFGKSGVRRLTFLTAILISYAFIILYLSIGIPAAGFSPVGDKEFEIVFGQSLWIIIGSLTAFLASQLIDVIVFWFFRKRTGGKMIWLRATGSTVVSQFIDSFVITFIAFWIPEKLNFSEFINLAATNYSYKLIIAILLTPLIYLGHNIIESFLGSEEKENLIKEAITNSLNFKSD